MKAIGCGMLQDSATAVPSPWQCHALAIGFSEKIPPGPPNLYGPTGSFSHNVISYSTALSGDFEAVPNLSIADL